MMAKGIIFIGQINFHLSPKGRQNLLRLHMLTITRVCGPSNQAQIGYVALGYSMKSYWWIQQLHMPTPYNLNEKWASQCVWASYTFLWMSVGGNLFFRLNIILVKGLSKHTLFTYLSGGSAFIPSFIIPKVLYSDASLIRK